MLHGWKTPAANTLLIYGLSHFISPIIMFDPWFTCDHGPAICKYIYRLVSLLFSLVFFFSFCHFWFIVCVSICLLVNLYVNHLSVCLTIHLSNWQSVGVLALSLSVTLSIIFVSVCVFVSVCLCVTHVTVGPSVRPPVCLYAGSLFSQDIVACPESRPRQQQSCFTKYYRIYLHGCVLLGCCIVIHGSWSTDDNNQPM